MIVQLFTDSVVVFIAIKVKSELYSFIGINIFICNEYLLFWNRDIENRDPKKCLTGSHRNLEPKFMGSRSMFPSMQLFTNSLEFTNEAHKKSCA